MSTSTTTQIWYRDPRAALGRAEAHRFVPLRTMNLTQQLNAVWRLAMYYSVIMTLLTRRSVHLTAAVVASVVTAAVHELAAREMFTAAAAGLCVPPTPGNPYMNVTLADLERRPKRGPACAPLAAATEQAIDHLDVPPPADGPYDNHGSRFYTMPVTTAVNDQGGFAQALYGGRQSNALGARA